MSGPLSVLQTNRADAGGVHRDPVQARLKRRIALDDDTVFASLARASRRCCLAETTTAQVVTDWSGARSPFGKLGAVSEGGERHDVALFMGLVGLSDSDQLHFGLLAVRLSIRGEGGQLRSDLLPRHRHR